jgi:hypothetical protein
MSFHVPGCEPRSKGGRRKLVTTAEIVITVVVVVVALVALVVGTAMVSRRRGRRQLRQQFGAEYDRTLATTGDPNQTDAQLRERVDQRDRLQLQPLSRIDRDAFAQEWRQIQSRFVDAPEESLAGADGLMTRVMRDSGYPVDDFDHQADLISVDHPELVDNYRKARVIRDASQQRPVGTEQQREALLAYRSLFSELLEQPSSTSSAPGTRS